MGFGICRIVKLCRNKAVGNFLCQLFCLFNCPAHAPVPFCQHNLRAICFELIPPFLCHGFRHNQNGMIASGCGNGSQTDAGVAGGGFNDCGARLDDAPLLRILNHCFRNAVLDASRRIHHFHFHQDSGLQSQCPLNISNLNQWGMSNQANGALINVCHDLCAPFSVL